MEVQMAVSLSTLSPAERHVTRVAELLSTAHTWTQVIDGDGESTWLIPSQSNGGVYSVDLEGWCDCPDALRRIERGGPRSERCKHGDALLAWLSAQPIVDVFKLTGEQRESIDSPAEPELCSGCNRTSIYHRVYCRTSRARRAAADRRACESLR
jgi:hypothetical protein